MLSSSRPNITERDLVVGFIMRYFVQNISTKKIMEVNSEQYEMAKSNPLYSTVEIKWIIMGIDENTLATNGQVIYGVKHNNQASINFYNKRMPGLNKMFTGPLEYFNGTNASMSRMPIVE